MSNLIDRLHSTSGQGDTLAGFPAHEMFAAASTAVLLADAHTGRLIAINPAAERMIGRPSAGLVGSDWSAAFVAPAPPELQSAARQALAEHAAVRVIVTTAGAVSAVRATFSTFHVAAASYLLIRLDAADEIGGNLAAFPTALFEQLDALPLGFVITDEALCVEYGNRAFVALVGETALDATQGHCLLGWLDLVQSDLDVMRRQLQLREAASLMTANLNPRFGTGQTVEVIAVAVPDSASAHWGFVLRPAARSTPKVSTESVN